MKKKRFSISLICAFIITLILSTFLTGCASIGSRGISSMGDNPLGLYPGVRTDFHILRMSFSSKTSETDEKNNVFLFVYAIIDFPFSLVLDTICLPYDMFHNRRYDKVDEEELNTHPKVKEQFSVEGGSASGGK